jgi:hypothetical protein
VAVPVPVTHFAGYTGPTYHLYSCTAYGYANGQPISYYCAPQSSPVPASPATGTTPQQPGAAAPAAPGSVTQNQYQSNQSNQYQQNNNNAPGAANQQSSSQSNTTPQQQSGTTIGGQPNPMTQPQ